MFYLLIVTLTLFAQNLKSYGSGFDAYTSCYRTSRKRPVVPCDFALQNWCNIPGSSYPWHAVRQFVHENQGLMRRMYGDERHISVLRAELDTNEVDFFHDAVEKETFRQRYSKTMASTLLSPKTRKRAKAHKMKKAIAPAMGESKFNSISETKKNSFGDLSKSTPLLTIKTLNDASPTTTEPPVLTTTATPATDTTPAATTSTASQVEVSEAQNVTETTLQPNETIAETTETDTPLPTTNAEEEEVTTEEVEVDGDDMVTEAEFAEQEMYEDSGEDEDTEDLDDVEDPVSEKSPPILRLKGINACPVKEEVVAPFWANNTRGEVLALLNLYPFEQYVHWEKCSYEHKQMFCREGCRCEQQYRLHRLLAYDPNNECRGIFSDWFRFPSCCVCKCYDVPMELRLTSRSPRSPILQNSEPGPT